MATRTYKSYKNDFSRLRVIFGPICEALRIRSPGSPSRRRARPQPDKYAGKHIQAELLEDVSLQAINRFLAAREEQNGWSPKTANLARQTLHRLFVYASKHHGFCSRDRRYPREYSPDGRHPNLCDYHNVDRTAGWKLMAGDYTRYGEVAELLHEADDCYVIMGHGEELTLRFPVEAFGPAPKGRRRTFILKTDSFCKDMDLYTAYPDTVEPLPFHAMSGYPYGPDERYPDNEKTRAYRHRYNTRRVRAR